MNSVSSVSPWRNFVASVLKSSNSRSRIGMMCPGTSSTISGFSSDPRRPWTVDGSMEEGSWGGVKPDCEPPNIQIPVGIRKFIPPGRAGARPGRRTSVVDAEPVELGRVLPLLHRLAEDHRAERAEPDQQQGGGGDVQ